VDSIVVSLSSENHNLESLEVIKSVSLVLTVHLKVRWGLFPCRCDFLFISLLLKGTGSGSFKDVSNLKFGQSKSLKWIENSWEYTHTINHNSVLIDEVNNDDHLTVVLTIVNEAYSAWFNKISKTLKSLNKTQLITDSGMNTSSSNKITSNHVISTDSFSFTSS